MGILYTASGNRRIDALYPGTGRAWPLIPEGTLGWVFNPFASPDGRRVALAAYGLGTGGGLRVIDAVDLSKRLLTGPEFVNPIGWSRDGTKIFAVSFRPPPGSGSTVERILEISAESGAVVPLPQPQLPGEISWISASPDARTFVCAVSQSVSDVVMVEGFDPEAR
jgi:hypothetical protein